MQKSAAKSVTRSENLDDYRRGSHSVYKLTYHVIFVTKYRKKVITDEIGDFMKNYAAYLCGRMNSELISAETDVDHMHLLISMPPDVAPVKLINSLKSQLSKEVRNTYRSHVEKYLWGDSPFWSASYFCATTGSVSLETVKNTLKSNEQKNTNANTLKRGNTKRKTSAIHPTTDFIGRGFLAHCYNYLFISIN